jgi:uncharacterized membrane protein YcaP (DUF421 family)
MQSQDVKLNDWLRLLVGEVPGSFYIELVIRAVVIYLLLTIAMRLLGKRMSSQLGRNDMVAMVTLAAAIGVPLQAPDRGLLPAIIIAVVVVYLGRLITAKASSNQKFEKFSQGNVDILVADSVMKPERMKAVRLSRERLIAQLRSNGIKHLGQVKRLYMEANGSFTLIPNEDVKPGLSIIPTWDDEYNRQLNKDNDIKVCEYCGYHAQQTFEPHMTCPNCRKRVWTNAVE